MGLVSVQGQCSGPVFRASVQGQFSGSVFRASVGIRAKGLGRRIFYARRVWGLLFISCEGFGGFVRRVWVLGFFMREGFGVCCLSRAKGLGVSREGFGSLGFA